jgi:hypothetical protein
LLDWPRNYSRDLHTRVDRVGSSRSPRALMPRFGAPSRSRGVWKRLVIACGRTYFEWCPFLRSGA